MDETLKPVLPEVFEEGTFPKLFGGLCPHCRRKSFPKPTVCPYCLEPVKTTTLSTQGTLYSYTVVRTKAPFALPEPYAVGYIDLKEDNLRIFSLLDSERIDDLRLGARVALCIGPIGVDRDGMPCLRFFFTPVQHREDL